MDLIRLMRSFKKLHVPSAGNAFHRFAQVKRALHLSEEELGVQERFTPQLSSHCESVVLLESCSRIRGSPEKGHKSLKSSACPVFNRKSGAAGEEPEKTASGISGKRIGSSNIFMVNETEPEYLTGSTGWTGFFIRLISLTDKPQSRNGSFDINQAI